MERLSSFIKVFFKPYTKRLLRDNILYIALFGGLIVLAVFAIPTALSKYQEYQTKQSQLQSEVDALAKKQRTLETVLAQTPPDLASDVTLMRTLIPDAEDYFSIIASLEELSKKTNFQIKSYLISVTTTSDGVLPLTVTGTGDQDSFLRFLQTYNFEGGRFITSQSIQLNPETKQDEGINIHLIFYSRPVDTVNNSGVNYTKALSRLSELKSKVNFEIKPATESASTEATLDYERKSDPF